MTDLEIIRLCAERMGPERCWTDINGRWYCCDEYGVEKPWNPLTNNADNAALDDVLLKHGRYTMSDGSLVFFRTDFPDSPYIYFADMTKGENRRRARCLCVAGMK